MQHIAAIKVQVDTLGHHAAGDQNLGIEGKYAGKDAAPRPGIILLDLNLPGTDGRDVLLEVKNDPDLKQIPIIVLTTSTDERDIRDCYAAGANSYIRKPVDLDGFFRSVEMLRDYWYHIVLLPKDGIP